MAKVGDTIKIIKLDDPYDPTYPGRTGEITLIDDAGMIHGTWGGIALIPGIDEFIIIKHG